MLWVTCTKSKERAQIFGEKEPKSLLTRLYVGYLYKNERIILLKVCQRRTSYSQSLIYFNRKSGFLGMIQIQFVLRREILRENSGIREKRGLALVDPIYSYFLCTGVKG